MAGQRLQRLHEGRSSVTVPSVRHRHAGAFEHHGHSAVMRAQCLPSTCPCRSPPLGPHVGAVRRSHSRPRFIHLTRACEHSKRSCWMRAASSVGGTSFGARPPPWRCQESSKEQGG